MTEQTVPARSRPDRPADRTDPTHNQLDPSQILQTATAFWASKVLLTAVEFDLFSVLADEPITAEELGRTLGLHPRGTYDFFDALVALKFLEAMTGMQAANFHKLAAEFDFGPYQTVTDVGGARWSC